MNVHDIIIEDIKLKDIVTNLLSSKELTDELLLSLYSIFGQTVFESLQILDRKMIVKYIFQPSNRSFYVVSGRKETKYLCLIEGDYCSCPSFNFSVLKSESLFCKHQLASMILQVLGKSEETIVYFNDSEYSSKVLYIESLSIKTPS